MLCTFWCVCVVETSLFLLVLNFCETYVVLICVSARGLLCLIKVQSVIFGVKKKT